PARVAALAEGGLQAMTTSKAKVALALMLAAGLVFAGAAALARSTPAAQADPGQAPEAAPQAGAAGPKAPAAQPDAKGKPAPADPAKAEVTASGQVVSADGKPVAGANVALLGRAKRAARGGHSTGVLNKTLTAGKTDPEGKFRLGATGLSREAYLEVVLVARASGHGFTQ